MGMYSDNEVIIHDGNKDQYVQPQVVDGEAKARGLVPRDYSTHPVGFYSGIPDMRAVQMPLIGRDQWAARCQELIDRKARISDVRMGGLNGQPIPARDQNGRGYCWMHSGVGAEILVRAIANLPYADLSAYACACIIKNYRDEGGWGAQGCDFLMSRGCPTSKFWPQRAVSKEYDTPETWEDAKKHKITGGYMDLQAAQYDRTLTFDQYATCLLLRIPVISDFNWWSHSVCAMDLVNGNTMFKKVRDSHSGKLLTVVEHELYWAVNNPVTAGYGVRILNSWGDTWSDHGMGVLTGSQAVPDGAVAPRDINVVVETAAA